MSKVKSNQAGNAGARRGTAKAGRVNFLAMALLSLALVASSCGSFDENAKGDTAGATGTAAAKQPECAIPNLPNGPKRDAYFELVKDIHGPTDDVSGEMNRLIFFPSMDSPKGADILEISANPDPSFDDDYVRLTSIVTFAAEGSADTLITFFETQFVQDWESKRKLSTTNSDGDPETMREYDQDGNGLEEKNLKITITESSAATRTLVEIEYTDSGAARSLVGCLAGWHGDIPLPAGAQHASSAIKTKQEANKTTIMFSSIHDYAEGVNTLESLNAQIVAAAEAGAYDFKENSGYINVDIADEAAGNDWDFEMYPSTLGEIGKINVSATIDFETAS